MMKNGARTLTRDTWSNSSPVASMPGARILAMFDALAEDIRPEVFRGCACMMTLVEFLDEALPAHQAAVGVKTWVPYAQSHGLV